MLRKLLRTYGNQSPVKPFLAFVHSEFVLYQAPLFETLLLPNSLFRHFKKLDKQPGSFSECHYIMADKLCQLSASTIPSINDIPSYQYASSRKGASCPDCGKLFEKSLLRKKLVYAKIVVILQS